ncbi:hypothetical protein [Myroides odoratus]|uniref:hypothetical protein n=1 Tax=Myroides odoratus TaxID=256 RepID=UPI000765A048|nr:hypothetical protein [Myroides odoratus]
MSIINEAKSCLKDIKSTENHILKENPNRIEKECGYKAIEIAWSRFTSKLTQQDIEKYKINIKERKLDNMYSVLESIIGY